ncbi:Hypothetical predicted protein [Paramuricea clavata]|uniref:Uncharacterized protein n=1 Tax=Paramuricea clavata TaxID=317549 RepID=A0A7D9IWP7_PARCT|nr:Hypothetical predicted protein [Paramuricea clavata]
MMITMRHLTCEAAPAKRPAQLDRTKVHDKAMLEKTYQTEKLLKKAIKKSQWFTKERSSKISSNCPFTWKMSKLQNKRLPRHVVEAECKGCSLSCKPLLYHVTVLINDGTNKMNWTTIPVKVAYIYDLQWK